MSCYDSRNKELHVGMQQLYTPWIILHKDLKDQGPRILLPIPIYMTWDCLAIQGDTEFLIPAPGKY